MNDNHVNNDLLGRIARLIAVALVVLLVGSAVACSQSPATPPSEEEEMQGEEPAPAEGEDEEEEEEEKVTPVGWKPDGQIAPGEYAHVLDNGTYKLYWTSTADTVRIGIEVSTEGWVALGLQPGQRMKDADMILGMVANGKAIMLDSYSSGDFGPHKADSEFGGTDDVVVFGGTESGGTTIMEFERALDTGDSYDIALERDVAIGIIWAYGSTDDEGQRHSTRGYGEIVP